MNLPRLLRLKKTQSLIIDYVHAPIRYFLSEETGDLVSESMLMPAMGENDVKFTRFIDMFGSTICHSVDGDFIPIALMHHEKMAAASVDNKQIAKIAIYRLEYNPPSSKASGQKRSASGQPKKSRTWEYVNISSLYNSTMAAFSGFDLHPTLFSCDSSQVDVPRGKAHSYMRLLAALIGLTGTDFSRSLPHLSPDKFWEALHVRKVWLALCDSLDHESGTFDVQHMCDHFVANVYKIKFAKHASGSTLESVMQSLQKSSLSVTTRTQLPSVARLQATIKNINWLLKYWDCVQPALKQDVQDVEEHGLWDYSACYPDAVAPEYGFKRSKKGKGAVTWLDDP